MRRGRLAVLLVLSMALAGCLGPTTASWGKGSGEIHVDMSEESPVIRTDLGPESRTFDDLQAVGCATESGELGSNTTTPLRFAGYLASSHFYDSHSALGGASGLDYAVSTSVAIQSMSLDTVKTMPEGEGPRVEVKNWDMPLNPETGSGSVDLDELDRDSESQWYILGLIPTTENIHEGMISLAEWHRPVSISGFLVQGNSTGNAPGYYNSQKAESDCHLSIGTSNNERVFVLVTAIELDGAIVSSSGESDEEWVYGDVPIFGRAGFILFFLIVGVGGSIGAFILSKMFVLQGAKSTMKTLLGKAGMDAVKQVKKDVKSAKSSGMSSPTERKKEMRKQAQKPAPDKKQKSSEPALAGFDLDSVLSTAPTSNKNTDFGGKGSSVVMTEESKQMQREISSQSSETTSSVPTSIRSTVPPRQTNSNVSSSVAAAPPQGSDRSSSSTPVSSKKPSIKGPPKRKTVRKRRATVKQTEAEPEPEPEPKPKQATRETYAETEEDFSDFSF